MALAECRECGHQVSTDAEACPGCGAKVKSGRGVGGWVFLLVGVGVLMWFASAYQKAGVATANPAPAPAGARVEGQPPTSVVAKPLGPGSQWVYSSNEDAMSGKVWRAAAVRSTNTLEFGWPYTGPQRGQLTLRHHPRWGKDAIVQIEKGQILCRSYEDCTVLVRFDDGDPVRFKAAGPADNSSTSFFMRDYAGFTSRALKAERVRISFEVYQNGAPMLEFDVSGFSQERFMR